MGDFLLYPKELETIMKRHNDELDKIEPCPENLVKLENQYKLKHQEMREFLDVQINNIRKLIALENNQDLMDELEVHISRLLNLINKIIDIEIYLLEKIIYAQTHQD